MRTSTVRGIEYSRMLVVPMAALLAYTVSDVNSSPARRRPTTKLRTARSGRWTRSKRPGWRSADRSGVASMALQFHILIIDYSCYL